jgi:hypothetical protein
VLFHALCPAQLAHVQPNDENERKYEWEWKWSIENKTSTVL